VAAPLRATFFALRRGGRGGVLFRALLVHLALALALIGGFFALNLTFFLGAAEGPARGFSTRDINAGIGFAFLLSVPFVLAYSVVMASYEAACLRWIVHRETDGFAGFSFSAPTWRVYAGQWMWLGISIPLVLAGAVLGAAVAGGARMLSSDVAAGAVAPFVVLASVVLPAALLGIRFAPGNAASVARRKFSYFLALTTTAGRYRALLASYFVVWLIWAATLVALFAGTGMLVFLILGRNGGQSNLASVLVWGAIAVSLTFANMVLSLLLTGINARAVIAAAEDGKIDGVLTADIANVFD
jgi:hypothetical protein